MYKYCECSVPASLAIGSDGTTGRIARVSHLSGLPGATAGPAMRGQIPSRWQLLASRPTLRGMDTPPCPGDIAQAARFEAEAASQHRLARRAEMIAQPRASSTAKRVVPSHESRARIENPGADHAPPTRRSGQ
jgi:hypothetical protein